MAKYPETKLDRAIGASLREATKRFAAEHCDTCLGTTRIYIGGKQMLCTRCGGTGKRGGN